MRNDRFAVRWRASERAIGSRGAREGRGERSKSASREAGEV
ncbi:hypothetical protein [Halorubrum aquaticum]